MARQVALLRGVNVGGRNKIPMAELRAVFESLGHTDVSTFIASGNVIFTTAKTISATTIEAAIEQQFSMTITVMLRTPSELAKALKANPFAGADPSTLHLGFMATKPAAATVKQLDAERFAPDEFAIHGRELYLHLPNGLGRSKLPPYIDRRLMVPVTVRNWNTVNKLVELSRHS
jgi:uncharacterized protein (DUF1697 family)